MMVSLYSIEKDGEHIHIFSRIRKIRTLYRGNELEVNFFGEFSMPMSVYKEGSMVLSCYYTNRKQILRN